MRYNLNTHPGKIKDGNNINNATMSSYDDHTATTAIHTDGHSEDLSITVQLVIYFQNFTHNPSSKDGKVLHLPRAQSKRNS
jgi:hypothetical protein